jgi:hypothetical protein
LPRKTSSDHSVTLNVELSTTCTDLHVPLFSPCGRMCGGRFGLLLEYGSSRTNFELAASSGFLPLFPATQRRVSYNTQAPQGKNGHNTGCKGAHRKKLTPSAEYSHRSEDTHTVQKEHTTQWVSYQCRLRFCGSIHTALSFAMKSVLNFFFSRSV